MSANITVNPIPTTIRFERDELRTITQAKSKFKVGNVHFNEQGTAEIKINGKTCKIRLVSSNPDANFSALHQADWEVGINKLLLMLQRQEILKNKILPDVNRIDDEGYHLKNKRVISHVGSKKKATVKDFKELKDFFASRVFKKNTETQVVVATPKPSTQRREDLSFHIDFGGALPQRFTFSIPPQISTYLSDFLRQRQTHPRSNSCPQVVTRASSLSSDIVRGRPQQYTHFTVDQLLKLLADHLQASNVRVQSNTQQPLVQRLDHPQNPAPQTALLPQRQISQLLLIFGLLRQVASQNSASQNVPVSGSPAPAVVRAQGVPAWILNNQPIQAPSSLALSLSLIPLRPEPTERKRDTSKLVNDDDGKPDTNSTQLHTPEPDTLIESDDEQDEKEKDSAASNPANSRSVVTFNVNNRTVQQQVPNEEQLVLSRKVLQMQRDSNMAVLHTLRVLTDSRLEEIAANKRLQSVSFAILSLFMLVIWYQYFSSDNKNNWYVRRNLDHIHF